MISLGKLKDMYKLQREAKKVKKELAHIHVEAEAEGIKVVVSAEPEIVDISISPSVSQERLPGLLKDALNRALKKGQVVSAQRMKPIMGEMGIGT